MFSTLSLWLKKVEELNLPPTEKENFDQFVDELYAKIDEGTVFNVLFLLLHCACASGLIAVSTFE